MQEFFAFAICIANLQVNCRDLLSQRNCRELVRGEVAEHSSRVVIYPVLDAGNGFVGELADVGTFWDEAAAELIVVLV